MAFPIRVGIADDDPVVRATLHHALGKSTDVQVVGVVEDGAAAVLLAQTGEVDVLVLDLDMPKMSGREALRWIRALAPSVRVLIHSSAPASAAAPEMLDAGATAYLQKPCERDRLLQAVREAMAH